VFWLATIVWQTWGATAGLLHAAQEPKRVLLLFPYNITFPADFIVGESLRHRLQERNPQSIVFYADFLDLGRFPDEDHELRTARYLADKYAKSIPDVVVALGPQALRFVLRHRGGIGPDVPVVFASISAGTLAGLKPPRTITGVTSEFDLVKALELARQIQPAAHDLVVISGASPFDRRWARTAQQQLKPYEQQFNTRYLVGLERDQLFAELRRLHRDTIVLYTVMFMDGAGNSLIPWEFVSDLAKVSNAPIYAPFDNYLGRGILGGFLESFESIGAAAADLVEEVLAGANTADLPPRPTNRGAYKVDARQMARWGISESLLPRGSIVQYREPTAWERYPWQISLIAFAMVAQMSLIVGLFYERRWRRIAEVEVRQRMAEIAHLNRNATVGEMSASIAHEINQPLAAIVLSANAGLRWLSQKAPNLDEASAALKRIAADGPRAGHVVETVRNMFRKDARERIAIDINEVIRDVLALLHESDVSVNLVLTDNLPRILADRVQLQQVILNIVRNAIEAMGSVTDRPRVLRLRSEANEGGEVFVTIEDSGPGIDASDVARIFEPFYTTKSEGMGMGLSICRSIVEAHGGRLSAAPGQLHGAVFQIVLPASA
jgi:signal transduction histidine kinase